MKTPRRRIQKARRRAEKALYIAAHKRLRYADLDYPDCSRCAAKKLNYYSARLTHDGFVKEVVCGDCNTAESLAKWDADRRLSSRNTMDAAMATFSMRVLLYPTDAYGDVDSFESLHTRNVGVVFGDDEKAREFSAVIYTPRDVAFPAPIAVKFGTDSQREFRSGRRFFAVEGEGAIVAEGVVLPWDMRHLDIHEASQRIHAAVKSPDGFEPRVWFGGLQAAVRATNVRALNGTFVAATGEAIEVTTYCCAGRCVIQIETPTDRVTVVTAEDESEPRMGVQGIDATEETALRLLAATTSAWAAGSVTMAETTNVGML